MKIGFIREKVDTTFYVDDIIFSTTNESLCKEFFKLVKKEFEMSMIGELKFFLRLQIEETNDNIYIQSKMYAKELLKKFKIDSCKMPTLDIMFNVSKKNTSYYNLNQEKHILLQSNSRETHLITIKKFRYLKGTNLGLLVGYCDDDYARDEIERRNTTSLNSYASKRQCTIAQSIVKVEYISTTGCCLKFLWVKHQLKDYNMYKECIYIGIFDIKFISIEYQLHDIFTKPLTKDNKLICNTLILIVSGRPSNRQGKKTSKLDEFDVKRRTLGEEVGGIERTTLRNETLLGVKNPGDFALIGCDIKARYLF
ncbi:Copia protein, partial [Mucuna pruriens]